MFWKKSSSTRRTPWCHSLNEDVLRLVIDEIDTLRGLYNLCQVSRQFYQLTVGKLYSFVDLDISKPSSQRLLQRLARPDDLIARYIRALYVEEIGRGQVQSAIHLSLALPRLVNLEILMFTGSVVSPKCILDTLCSRHGVVDSNLHAAVLRPGMPQPLYTSMAGLVYTKLSFLYVGLEIADQVHDTFKIDLMQMLLHARCLKVLQIWIDFEISPDFSELSPDFSYHGLPRLQQLWMVTGGEMQVLTPVELGRWGRVGGWSNLRKLTFERPRDLPAFIGRVPKLRSLCFIPQRNGDMDSLASCLHHAQCDEPFGKELQSIRLRGLSYAAHLAAGLTYAIPWCILKHAQNVTKLKTHRLRYEGWLPGSRLTTVTKQDLVQLRSLCPKLEEFWVDLVYGPKSPADINVLIFNLARIEKLNKLVIFVHNGSSRFRKTFVTRWDCRAMFNTIVKQRMIKELPCEAPFTVEFKLVREWDKIKGHFYASDYQFWIDRAGLTKFKRRSRVASWNDYKGNFRRDYYKARDSLHRAFRGEVVK